MRILLISLLLGLMACGGRVAELTETKQANDANLTCAHLAAEKEVNLFRVTDLTGESDFATQNNLGLLISTPLFLDFSDTIQREVRSLNERNLELGRLSRAKGCVGT